MRVLAGTLNLPYASFQSQLLLFLCLIRRMVRHLIVSLQGQKLVWWKEDRSEFNAAERNDGGESGCALHLSAV